MLRKMIKSLMLLLSITLVWGAELELFVPDPEQQAAREYYLETQEQAEQGKIEAQCELAYLQLEGSGTNKNPQAALKNFQKAAAGGSSEAQFMLGNIYFMGLEGLEQNQTLAYNYYELAAQQGDIDSIYMMGLCSMQGLGTKIDMKKAEQKLLQAGKEGHDMAEKLLGEYYSEGKGGEIDESKALYWYAKAAAKGDGEGLYRMGLSYRYPDMKSGVRKRMAYQRFEDAVLEGEVGAMYEIALCYLMAYGTEEDVELGMEYMIDAAAEGDKRACLYVALGYYMGFGVEASWEEARYWAGRVWAK